MQNNNQRGRNNFFDDDPYERKRSLSGYSRKPAAKQKKSAGIPVVWVFVIDTAIAALLLFIFSLYYFIIPRDMSQNAVVLPGAVQTQETARATSSAQGVPSQSPEAADTQTAAAPDADSWRVKFADKFTDGAVEKTENSYKSANVSVTIDKVQKDGVTYFVADIYIADIKYFRTAFAKDTFGSGIADFTPDIASQNNAVIAINGDYCGLNKGIVVRNSVQYRDTKHTSDQFVLFNDGTMKAYSPDEFDYDTLKNQGLYQVWTFGPMLLKDGQPMEKFNCTVNPKNPRTAVGYYEPGHYCFVVVDGRQPGYSDGYSTKEMSQLMYSLNCKEAFNLDGGKSSEMAFEGALYNKPFDGGRETSDILYIADE